MHGAVNITFACRVFILYYWLDIHAATRMVLVVCVPLVLLVHCMLVLPALLRVGRQWGDDETQITEAVRLHAGINRVIEI